MSCFPSRVVFFLSCICDQDCKLRWLSADTQILIPRQKQRSQNPGPHRPEPDDHKYCNVSPAPCPVVVWSSMGARGVLREYLSVYGCLFWGLCRLCLSARPFSVRDSRRSVSFSGTGGTANTPRRIHRHYHNRSPAVRAIRRSIVLRPCALSDGRSFSGRARYPTVDRSPAVRAIRRSIVLRPCALSDGRSFSGRARYPTVEPNTSQERPSQTRIIERRTRREYFDEGLCILDSLIHGGLMRRIEIPRMTEDIRMKPSYISLQA